MSRITRRSAGHDYRMDVLALLVALAAIVVFVAAHSGRVRWGSIPVGLALLTAAWIIDAVHLTGTVVTVTH